MRLEKLNKNTDIIIALGYFDALHKGHQSIISATIKSAMANQCCSAILTFDDNFLHYLSRNEKIIYPIEERRIILNQLGLDYTIVLTTTNEFFYISPLEFLDRLQRKYSIKGFVCGNDFKFGKSREGDVNFLKNYAKKHKLELVIVEPYLTDSGEKISSTSIRMLISKRQITEANSILGREFSITGVVVSGKKNGGKFGFPTANLAIPNNKLLPGDGVYSTHTTIEGVTYKSITNIGYRPTIDNQRTIETHLIGYSGDLYNSTITVFFKRFLRETIKFNDPSELCAQLNKDKAEVSRD
ncbi:MAG: bifunctional riboflavin kinase/FAD synthetase [Christensenellaceae bacterium]|nr:bifunctional riboflavin kinase/FAD synthetase [Christensenellaceae bacterium]